ncbi:MAG TPA: sulfate ABC transporter substrate-binding protein [Polyangiaceae bacterium]|nr:sulfate ABC transporter substrate-binding protein [Polyangiaceae bacterium]
MKNMNWITVALFAISLMACKNEGQSKAATIIGAAAEAEVHDVVLLNVSYDPTREFYDDFNKAFADEWQKTQHQKVTIKQSHGGSGKQARAVIDGLEADVVTLALAYDVDQVQKAGLIGPNWQSRLQNNSAPYTSTIVFLVRKGNPKGIKDWDDLVKPGIQVILPNPKTSGGARWNYLAAWGHALRKNSNDESKARDFVSKLYKNVPVLDSGARGSTTTFVERGIGDVLVGWENEALLGVESLGKDKFEIVNPSESILAEPPVAVVDKYAEKHQTKDVAEGYLKFLYSQKGQELAAKHYFRATDQAVSAENARRFPTLQLFTIKDVFGDWTAAQRKHFDDGGVFDQIYSGSK